jgi:geranylgeranyl diphosphate synthase type II
MIDRALDRFLPRKGKLAKAMRYSVFAGGKRFRPVLCMATAEALGSSSSKVMPLACAVEMIHTFTLIHDDLPAMDNSDYRRGKLTSHKVFGEAIAILAGDALNTLAFRIISNYPRVIEELSEALLKVVAGQVLDIETAGKRPSLVQIENIHRLKTGALLEACVNGVAFICRVSRSQKKALVSYARHLGLAFQIADDILDVTSTRKEIGKPVGADSGKGFPRLVGLEKSRARMEEEKRKAVQALKSFDKRADRLRQIAEFVVKRSA